MTAHAAAHPRQRTVEPNDGPPWAKRTVVTTAAIMGIVSVLGLLHLLMLRAILQPAIRESMDQVARESATRDSTMMLRIEANTDALTQMSRDRIILMTVLETPAGASRDAFVAALKEQWTTDAQRQYGRAGR